MTFTIPLSSISLSPRERCYVLEALDQEMLSSAGPHVRRFEESLASRIGVRHAVATASGTSALELVLRALGVGAGDEVVVPALTFAGPALAVALVGAVPVFADVSPETWTIDSEQIEMVCTTRTRAVIAVDVLGHPCDYDRLARLGLPIIEDAAEAHGAQYKGRNTGAFGVAAIFSFHANKMIACGEGGCVLTDDTALADRIRLLNAFGMDPDRRYWHLEIGCNHRMNNLTAAIALGQVERWDELAAARANAASAYDRALTGLNIHRRPVASWARESVWLYTIASEQRPAILRACQRRGVDARAIWPALPDNPAFAKYSHGDCRHALRIAECAMWLPTWSGISLDAIRTVTDAVRSGLQDPSP